MSDDESDALEDARIHHAAGIMTEVENALERAGVLDSMPTHVLENLEDAIMSALERSGWMPDPDADNCCETEEASIQHDERQAGAANE